MTEQAKGVLLTAIEIGRAGRSSPRGAKASMWGYGELSVEELAGIWRKESEVLEPSPLQMLEKQLGRVSEALEAAKASLACGDADQLIDDINLLYSTRGSVRAALTLWVASEESSEPVCVGV